MSWNNNTWWNDTYEPQSELSVSFANSGALNSWWLITYTITSNRFNDIDFKWFWVWLPEWFTVSPNSSFEVLSGSLIWKSCTTVTIEKDYFGKKIKCQLNSMVTGFSDWDILSFALSGVVNPINAWKYFMNVMLKTDVYDEFFFTEKTLKDISDITSPQIAEIFVKDPYQVVVKLNEPIDNLYWYNWANISVIITWNDWSTLNVWWFYDDWDTHKKLFINTDQQTWWVIYSILLSWTVSDFNWNDSTNLTWTFVWYDDSQPSLSYIVPWDFPKWSDDLGVWVYGNNNIFQNTNAYWDLTINMWSWVSVDSNSFERISSDQIYFEVDVDANADLWSRDAIFTISWTQYKLFNAYYVNKNWNDLVNIWWSYTKDFNNVWWTWTLIVNFDTEVTNNTINSNNFDFSVWYWTWSTPTLNWSITKSDENKTLIIPLSNVYMWNWYNVSFTWLNFTWWKSLDTDIKRWFDFFESNGFDFTNKILPPIVISSYPYDWANDMPLNTSIEVYFDQPLQSTTVTTTNITLKDSQWTTVAWTVDYDSWANKMTFTPSSQFTYSTDYILTLSNSITNDKWLWLVGNIPFQEWNWHRIHFTTQPDYDTLYDWYDSWWWAWSMPTNNFYVDKVDPYPWAFDIPKDVKLSIWFSEKINTWSVNANTIKLLRLWSSWDTINWDWDNIQSLSNILSWWNFTYNFNSDWKFVKIYTWNDLQPGIYRFVITNWVKNIKWQYLDWSFENDDTYDWWISEFEVWTQSFSDMPLKIQWSWSEPDYSRFQIWFTNPIEPSTVTKSNIKFVDANLSNQDYDLKYEPQWNYIDITLNSALSADTIYKILLYSWLNDLGWNVITWSNDYYYTWTNWTWFYYNEFTTDSTISDNPLYVKDFMVKW
jgi:hypothetical protein